MRKGNRVYLIWTIPSQTTDRQSTHHLGITRICRRLGQPLDNCSDPIAEVPSIQSSLASRNGTSSPKAAETYTDALPDRMLVNPFANVFYAVEVMNDRGRSAGLSNQAAAPAAPTLPPPAHFAAHLTAGGVTLSWTPLPEPPPVPGLRYLYRIDRREENGNRDIVTGEVPVDAHELNFVDHNFEWEKRYSYHANVVTLIRREADSEAEVEGDDTSEISIFTHDIFPPAVPSGLQAVFTSENQQLFIDLIWHAGTDADLAGYNVFRDEDGGPVVKINDGLVMLPAFRDMRVSAGRKYHYSVSAVDIHGNQSARSEEASEDVP
jgi:hypothetical protein